MSDLSLSPFGDRRRGAPSRVTVSVSAAVVGAVLWWVLTAAMNAHHDDAKLDAARFERDSINRTHETREVIQRLDLISCRQVKPAAECAP